MKFVLQLLGFYLLILGSIGGCANQIQVAERPT